MHPDIIWWNGSIVPWQEATVHVTSETAMRGTNVFEGVRAYWQERVGRFAVVALDEHLERLRRSARILSLPADHLLESLLVGVNDLIRALGTRSNLYLRPTIYLDQGSYTASGADLKLGAFIVGRPTEVRTDRPIACVISSWERIADSALPSLAKIGAAYTAFRFARQSAVSSGADEAILLNARGSIAETPGAAVFVVRDGRVSTPPLSDGVLEGVTRRIATDLLSSALGITVAERSICRSELYSADEVFLCGTLDEIRSVGSVDDRPIPESPGPITRALRNLYLDTCEGRDTDESVSWLHFVSIPPPFSS